MPFDDNTHHIVFSLEGLIGWLKTQDPETEYDWESLTDCLLHRYLKAHGFSGYDYRKIADVVIPPVDGWHTELAPYTIGQLALARNGWSDEMGEWTYAAALKRAEALLGER